jgi:hypothetical protein
LLLVALLFCLEFFETIELLFLGFAQCKDTLEIFGVLVVVLDKVIVLDHRRDWSIP